MDWWANACTFAPALLYLTFSVQTWRDPSSLCCNRLYERGDVLYACGSAAFFLSAVWTELAPHAQELYPSADTVAISEGDSGPAELGAEVVEAESTAGNIAATGKQGGCEDKDKGQWEQRSGAKGTGTLRDWG
jgi:hypothetical protein